MFSVVSVALGRPFAIHDDDIDIAVSSSLGELTKSTNEYQDFSASDNTHPTSPEHPDPPNLAQPSDLAVPLHILSLRRIASAISRQVYSTRNTANLTPTERSHTLSTLHHSLLTWRRNMPFPLPDHHQASVPHLTTTWYDFNYYTHLALLYRPSPLYPSSDLSRIRILESAASQSIRLAYSMHQQQRLAYNWLTFLALFTSTISLVYAVTAQPEDLGSYLKEETRAVEDLELVMLLFETLAVKFVAATKIRNMVGEIVRRYKSIRGGMEVGSGSGSVGI